VIETRNVPTVFSYNVQKGSRTFDESMQCFSSSKFEEELEALSGAFPSRKRLRQLQKWK